jgi:hypothetical protein
MAEQKLKEDKEGGLERTSRFFRNAHLLGTAALVGAAVVLPPLAAPLEAVAAFEGLHAGAWEVARRASKRRRRKKSK